MCPVLSSKLALKQPVPPVKTPPTKTNKDDVSPTVSVKIVSRGEDITNHTKTNVADVGDSWTFEMVLTLPAIKEEEALNLDIMAFGMPPDLGTQPYLCTHLV